MTETDTLELLRELAVHVSDMNTIDGRLVAAVAQLQDDVRALSNRVEALTRLATMQELRTEIRE